MKKIITVFALTFFVAISAQESANRFFYELTFKPRKDSLRTEKVMTILDISKDKSIYQDYTIPAQDSIMKAEVEAMEKSGVFKNLMKSIRMPKFSHKVVKTYPDMKVSYNDQISMRRIGYEDPVKLDWKILPEKVKIGEYNAQKATTEFGGRKWTAWFSSEIPLQDGPYKFYGLPGLIVKLEDADKNYSWTLQGNKKIENYSEEGFAESMGKKYGQSTKVVMVDRAKFEKSYENYKADPLGEMRPYMKPEMMSMKMPGSDQTMGEFMKDMEKMSKDYFNSNTNPIEISAAQKK